MRAVAAYAGALRGVVERDLRIFVSYRSRAATQLLSLVLSMSVFYFVSRLVNVPEFRSSDDYFAFVVAGLLIMFVLQAATAAPLFLRQELVAGTFERSLVSPMGPVVGILALMAYPVLFACLLGAVAFGVATAIFGLPVRWATAPALLPAALLGALVFAVFTTLALAMVVVFKQAAGITWLVTLLTLTGGVYFPVALLPAWIGWISEIQPFTPAVDLLRHLMLGTSVGQEASTAVLKLVGFLAVAGPLSFLLLRRAVEFARVRGTILEY
jgi:ABC-2 type transport system permease protein